MSEDSWSLLCKFSQGVLIVYVPTIIFDYYTVVYCTCLCRLLNVVLIKYAAYGSVIKG